MERVGVSRNVLPDAVDAGAIKAVGVDGVRSGPRAECLRPLFRIIGSHMDITSGVATTSSETPKGLDFLPVHWCAFSALPWPKVAVNQHLVGTLLY
jgi:hypothetical protein